MTGISNAYPKGWPELASGILECPDISGVYKDRGLYSHRSGNFSEFLAYRLDDRNITFRADSVRVSKIDGDTFSVVAFNVEGKPFEAFTLSRGAGDYECVEGKIWLPTSEESVADGTGFVGTETKIGFSKAIDGSLIGETRHFSYGVAMWVVPGATTQVFWYQWQLAE
ncbi:hypothetical protein JYT96_01930 [Gammaproteobacteria bacterium AH-315-C21]|nr:hypothetical protein [Gammaproteobacteria bacterium AH-315-C21]